jgi:hypothetical protein
MIGYPCCSVCGTETTLDSSAQEPWKCAACAGITNVDDIPVGLKLDTQVAWHIFGDDCKPPRDKAIVQVVWRMVTIAGNPTTLRNGRDFFLPPRDELPEPEGATNGNDRYMLYIGKQMLPEIEPAIEQYRSVPPRYSTDIDATMLVADAMRAKGFIMTLVAYPLHRAEHGWWCSFDRPQSGHAWQAQNIKTSSEALCRAALRAHLCSPETA